MKALILAAGFSTRLYPLTEYKPKALLEVWGKPIINQVVEGILSLREVDDVALVTNSRYYQEFDTWTKADSRFEHIHLLNNKSTAPENRLGAIGDIHFSLSQLGWDDDLLVVASDTLTSLNLNSFVEFFNTHRGIVNAVFDIKDEKKIEGKLGNPVVEQENIVKFLEKPVHPESTLVSIPYYIYPKELLSIFDEYLKVGGNADAPGSIISWAIGKKPVFAYDIGDGYYYDVGTHEMLERLQREH